MNEKYDGVTDEQLDALSSEKDKRIAELEVKSVRQHYDFENLTARQREMTDDRNSWREQVQLEISFREVVERERDEALAKVAELEVHRAPNPGMVGTIRDKNSLLECKDQLIAQLRARIAELEAHTKVAESDFVSSLLRIHGLLGMADDDAREIDVVVKELVDDRDNLRAVLRHTIQGVDSPSK